jgi:hypothetical protein
VQRRWVELEESAAALWRRTSKNLLILNEGTSGGECIDGIVGHVGHVSHVEAGGCDGLDPPGESDHFPLTNYDREKD